MIPPSSWYTHQSLPVTPLLGRLPAQLSRMSYTSGPYHGPYRGNLRGPTAKTARRSANKISKVMIHAGAQMKYMPSCVIGKSPRISPLDRVRRMMNPATHFNSKWTMQADGIGGRVTAFQIPILTDELSRPIYNQLRGGALTTDSALVNEQMSTGGHFTSPAMQYRVAIENYTSHLSITNSSEHTNRVRIVWYKPVSDFDVVDENFLGCRNEPLNLLMYASTYMQSGILNVVGPAVGDGRTFDNATVNSDWSVNYNHCGHALTGLTTNNSNLVNRVVALDPQLVPGSSEVRAFMSKKYRVLKSTEVVLQPGHETSTVLRIKKRMFLGGDDDDTMYVHKRTTHFAVVYFMGQMVNSNVSNDTTISTGSSQLSIIRSDDCYVSPYVKKAKLRINMTSPLVILAANRQEVINQKTDTVDTQYGSAF